MSQSRSSRAIAYDEVEQVLTEAGIPQRRYRDSALGWVYEELPPDVEELLRLTVGRHGRLHLIVNREIVTPGDGACLLVAVSP